MTGKISWNQTLVEMDLKLTPATKMRIGPRGGRFVVIDGKDYPLNSLYKMIKHICAKGLSPQEKTAGRHLMETLGKLDEKGSNLKKNKISGEPKTSFIQKRLTELKSMVGKLLFSRSKEVSKLKNALDFVEPQNTSSNTRRGKQPNGNGAGQSHLEDDTQSRQEHETQQQHQSQQTKPATIQPVSILPNEAATIPSLSILTTSNGNADALPKMLADVPADKIIDWINSGKCKSEDFSLADLNQEQAEKLLEGFKSIDINQIYESSRFFDEILKYCEHNQLQEKFMDALNNLSVDTKRYCMAKKMIGMSVAIGTVQFIYNGLNFVGPCSKSLKVNNFSVEQVSNIDFSD